MVGIPGAIGPRRHGKSEPSGQHKGLGKNKERSFKFARDVTGQCMKAQGSKREAKDLQGCWEESSGRCLGEIKVVITSFLTLNRQETSPGQRGVSEGMDRWING